MCSPSTKPATERPCPKCGSELKVVVISEVRDIGAQRVLLEGLMPCQCSACNERVWPESERRRAKWQADVKLGKAAA